MTWQRVPRDRIRTANDRPVRGDGEFVLYWMIASRRLGWNFAQQRAVEWALELRRPLLILEALEADYPWASDRTHAFVLQGMADNAAAVAGTPAAYHPYVEPTAGAGAGLLQELANRAAVVVTDDYPAFFLPRLVASAARRIAVRLEAVDSLGILPQHATDKAFARAVDFRRFLHRELPAHMDAWPAADPLEGADLQPLAQLPEFVRRKWPAATASMLRGEASRLAGLPIDHSVAPVVERGGAVAARERLDRFLEPGLEAYGARRHEPDGRAASELSAYLHFGHISAHEILHRVIELEGWTPLDLAPEARGGRAGWGMGAAATEFVDQLVTWRELGANMCVHRLDYAEFDSLPDWARRTLLDHATDPREHTYSLEEFAESRTHDPLWNAAQTQLRREGRIHNYLRMLWGKKILEWSRSPVDALDLMIELNNRYALDGRDPNSYSGIFWVLGRYDRPWGPERPVFGKVRYMSSENTARKLRVHEYLSRYGPGAQIEAVPS